MSTLTLAQVLDTLDLKQVNECLFVGTQLEEIGDHIVGGHIAAQALMAASQTVSARAPHSMHVYFLRRGDARHPVEFEVTTLHDGGTFSARRVTARQFGAVLLEGTASFSVPVDNHVYQQPQPDAPDPETLAPLADQLNAYADEFDGWWVRQQPVELRYVDAPARLAFDLADAPSTRTRIWWRPNGIPPTEPLLATCLVVYVSGRTLLEPAMIARRTTPLGPGISALIDHAVWFHQPPDLSDWLLYDQHSPSGIGGRALASGAMFNRGGQLVCTTTLEGYFGRRPPGAAER
ncbi:acyl-CoA thioesterase II [Mycobacterium kyorinense]|uniref:Acyl-CoA thioesterase II n=1 Tax=Mycobacterium kyorinense TaxID=487514 RepID=A0A1A2YTH6_9MYCO|nr:acyl-CoA thioesterase domain-containing protein [Mycobacterium kyorinense]OBI41554.1 acyl-CoA thioesterase II [Mycobacterium kyorinense]